MTFTEDLSTSLEEGTCFLKQENTINVAGDLIAQNPHMEAAELKIKYS